MDLTEAGTGQNRHFWELSRADMVLKEAGNLQTARCLDFGAGDLYFANQLAQRSSQLVVAFDPMAHYETNKELFIATSKIEKLTSAGHFEKVFLLDVLEHVQNESDILEVVKDLLSPEGTLLVTVPAFQFLFSQHDIFLKHFRRYNQKGLIAVLNANGFQVKRTWYFYSSLLLIRVIQKLLPSHQEGAQEKGVGGWAYGENHFVTIFCKMILNLDFKVMKMLSKVGIRLPGLSIFAECQKTSA